MASEIEHVYTESYNSSKDAKELHSRLLQFAQFCHSKGYNATFGALREGICVATTCSWRKPAIHLGWVRLHTPNLVRIRVDGDPDVTEITELCRSLNLPIRVEHY